MLIRLSKVKLLIVDDWGFTILTDKERRIFLDILEDRYDISSTIISSQLPVENWHDKIADPTVADAICDRLIHNAHRIRLTSVESMRKSYSNLKET
jgi:DNA replication protein DnaC